MTRNQIDIDQKFTTKTTKTQGQVSPRRINFIDEIICKYESQVWVGPQVVSGKGSVVVAPPVVGSSIAPNTNIHDKIVGFEYSFQDIF